MAIVEICHATIIGQAKIKHQCLEGLQHLGFLHLISQTALGGQDLAAFKNSPTYEAYLFLKHSPEKRRQNISQRNFQTSEIEQEALSIKERMIKLSEEKIYLQKRINSLEPWGNFEFVSLAEMSGLRFWFYTIPLYHMREMEELDLVWQCVFRDNRNAYVVVINEEEPDNMPAPRTHTGNRSLATLRKRLDQVESELEDLYWRRVGLTRWLTLYAKTLAAAEDRNELQKAAEIIYDDGKLFVVEAWLPKRNLKELKKFTDLKGLLLTSRPPAADELPPTLLDNSDEWQSGQTLVKFYTTPGYYLWDPSKQVFLFFVLFFSMIVSDAGYGLLIGLIWLLSRRKLQRRGNGLDLLIFYLFIGTALYGIFSGSYFGISPPPGSLLEGLHFFNVENQDLMMLVSVILGVLHLSLANSSIFLYSRRRPHSLAPLGWIGILLGGLLWGVHLSGMLSGDMLRFSGQTVFVAGILTVLFFSSERKDKDHGSRKILLRLLDGITALSGLTKIFGDVLSYLRLFALGLATAQLAVTFNGLADEAMNNIAGLGTLVAILIVFFGHGINFLLALMSGVVHGLRLNFIEFFNWGLAEEGYPFKPFQRREIGLWNQL
jgi:V/A-type H+-transporting ATPase subunit I